ncbi:zinc-dependent metalloprotease [Boudabousia marimammalium]|uniref:Hydrolase n=1 Tax=Boudabousia marimammalium TaxID=156892 RepID=A0A1Q5PM58_9ACTO|nr:zinc-dependent metalloprotease [Boudabousia marimammalium]OKL48067.1 hypothetical protein BM477_06265 [Boudabousia marimammalium]
MSTDQPADSNQPEDEGNQAFDDFFKALEGIVPEHELEQVKKMLQEQGLDLENLDLSGAMGIGPNGAFMMPGGGGPIMSVIGDLFGEGSEGPVNWKVAHQLATEGAQKSGNQTLTAAQAAQYRTALQVAGLWLDAVTDLRPASVEPEAWTRTQWVEATEATWRSICEPVALNASRAISKAMGDVMGNLGFSDSEDMSEHLPPEAKQMIALIGGAGADGDSQNPLGGMMDRMGATLFGMQMGHAIGALASETLGYTAIGIPMLGKPRVALVPRNVEEFGEGFDIPANEVTSFVAVRESAFARLFAAVPWLRHHVLSAVEAYSKGIDIDTDAVEDAARSMNFEQPQSFQDALSGGMFTPQISPEQQKYLDQLQTVLAVIEGWVEEVTLRATLPHIPHAIQLDEMIRRRRASGSPAEKIFHNLVGLQLSPKRSRDAKLLWSTLTDQIGPDARDAFWAHPSTMPTMEELDNPTAVVQSRQQAAEKQDEMDAQLEALLEGKMGWAEGLAPEDDSEGDTRAQNDGEDSASPEA